jgi:hypothetical protein
MEREERGGRKGSVLEKVAVAVMVMIRPFGRRSLQLWNALF